MRGQAGGIQAGVSSQQRAKRQVFQASLHNAGEYPQRADNGLEDKQNAGQGRKAHNYIFRDYKTVLRMFHNGCEKLNIPHKTTQYHLQERT